MLYLNQIRYDICCPIECYLIPDVKNFSFQIITEIGRFEKAMVINITNSLVLFCPVAAMLLSFKYKNNNKNVAEFGSLKA